MISVTRSTVIEAPIDDVWALLRDFNNHDSWHPAVMKSDLEITDHPDQIGAVRNFELKEGQALRERLLSMSDRDFQFSYSIIESPDIPLLDYVATVSLKAVTDSNQTLWRWQSKFRTPAGQERELADLVARGVYESGFAAVREHFARPETMTSLDESVISSRSYSPNYSVGAMVPAAVIEGGVDRLSVNEESFVAASPSQTISGADIPAKAIIIDQYGDASALRYVDATAKSPDNGQVQIRQTAIGVNFIDIYCRSGFFDLLKPPGVPGMEAAGVVVACGGGVDHLRPGQRVVYACAPVGAYCSVRTMDAVSVYPLPDAIDDETAAASFLKGLTSQFLVTDVHAISGKETVLVYAPAGAIGQLLCQQLKNRGAKVIGATSSEHKARIARAAGADAVVMPGPHSLEEQVLELTNGDGVDVVYDAVGHDSFEHSLAALAPRGHLVSYGQASGPIGQWNIDSLAAKSVTVSRPNFSHYTEPFEALKRLAESLFADIEQRKLSVDIGARFSLADAATAHRQLENRETTGSIVLIPDRIN